MMICPKCGSSENIVFFVRHMKTDENDESTTANCVTVLHADPQCGYNESMLLKDVANVVFTEWSELAKLEERVSNINPTGGLGSLFNSIGDMIETEGEVVEETQDLLECESCELPAAEIESD